MRQPEDLARDELLMRSPVVKAQVVQPANDRVSLAVRDAIRRRQQHLVAARGGLMPRVGSDTERGSCIRDRRQILCVLARVPKRLSSEKASVADQVSQKNDVSRIPQRRSRWVEVAARDAHTVADGQLAERSPSLKLSE